MICKCESCRYLFKERQLPERCPDCGSKLVRPANKPEQTEWTRIRMEFYPEEFENQSTQRSA